MSKIKVLEPCQIPASIMALPCDKCGDKVRTASFYLTDKSSRKMVQGFYSDLYVRLCQTCLQSALAALGSTDTALAAGGEQT